MATASIEALPPEIAALIMKQISSPVALDSLVHASPCFYRVFVTCKTNLLFNFARQQFEGSTVLPNAINAVQTLRSPPALHDLTDGFLIARCLLEHYDPVISLQKGMLLCRLSVTVDWFVADFWRDSQQLLNHLGKDMGLPQDLKVIGLAPSPVEFGRLQRAFYRFETLRRFLGISSNKLNYN